jgi:signal transduction histidine kinase
MTNRESISIFPRRRASDKSLTAEPLPTLLGQLVICVDDRGRVNHCDTTLAGEAFGSTKLKQVTTIHDVLHPECPGDCTLITSWPKIFCRLRKESLVECEIVDDAFDRLLRLRMLRTADAEDSRTYAVINVVDITKGRAAVLTLQETNQGLNRMFKSNALQLYHALGDVARNKQRIGLMDERLRMLSSRLILAQERERERIFTELHDGLGQRLCLARYSIERCRDQLLTEANHSDSAITLLNGTCDHLDESISEIRDLAQDMKHSVLDELGIIVALELLVQEFQSACSDVAYNVQIEACDTHISYEVSVAMYRIAQEALSNNMQHAGATKIDFFVRQSADEFVLRITDNGRGFDLDNIASPESGKLGSGLHNMKTRAAAIDGLFDICSSKTGGTTVSVLLRHGAGQLTEQQAD